MERFAEKDLVKWNDNKFRKPLILWGARQVGKTYLIRDIFAEKYYKGNYIYVDFKVEDEIRDFCFKTANAKKIIEFISLQKSMPINEKTLLIFDEIQECPNIVSALKYFCQEYREIPVIATGSMVRIKLHREIKKSRDGSLSSFLFPVGKINELTIYPLTLGEYLFNINKGLYQKLYESYKKKEPLDTSLHNMAMDYVFRYMLIGAMPEAISTYIETEDLYQSREVLKVLYNNYLSDMELYQASRESVLRSRALFSNIYKELNKESKNFAPGLIEEKSKTRDYTSALDWLVIAHIINPSYQLKEHITTPLIGEQSSAFRLYLSDIGMFSYQSGINASSFISPDKENMLSGFFFENFVANELTAHGIPLFYWKGKLSAELEFIVESDNKLYPIDVKKGRGILNSLEKFSNHNKYEFAIKISKNNYGYDDSQRIMTVPFYYASFLAEDLANGTLTNKAE